MNYQEAFNHPQFKVFFQQEVEQTDKLRMKFLLEDTKSNRLKSTPYSRLKEEGKLTVEWMTEEFIKVQMKQSEQPVHIRDFIGHFVHSIAAKTAVWFDKHEKEMLSKIAQSCVTQEFEDVSKAKKPRKKTTKKSAEI